MEHTILRLLLSYKYFLIVPLAFLEGHLISLIAGFLSKLGYLNPFISGILIVLGNLLGDICLYWLGFYKGKKIVGKFGRFLGITEKRINKTKVIFQKYHASILFFSKITNGFGMAMAVLFTAGMSQIPFLKFVFWNIIGDALWTGSLVFIGYSLGNLYYLANNYLTKALVIPAIFFVILIFSLQFKRYVMNKLEL